MHYPNKPHFKIFASILLLLSQYFLLNSHYTIGTDKGYEMIAFGILTANTLIGSVVVGSTAYDIRKQIQGEIQKDLKAIQNEAVFIENQIEKFEHIILDEATLLLGAKAYRSNPILSQFE
jgi:hypothetical protein